MYCAPMKIRKKDNSFNNDFPEVCTTEKGKKRSCKVLALLSVCSYCLFAYFLLYL